MAGTASSCDHVITALAPGRLKKGRLKRKALAKLQKEETGKSGDSGEAEVKNRKKAAAVTAAQPCQFRKKEQQQIHFLDASMWDTGGGASSGQLYKK